MMHPGAALDFFAYLCMTTVDEQSMLRLFEEVLPAVRSWEQDDAGQQPQIYSLPVVIWMMLCQRLDKCGTQQAVVHQLATGKLDRLLPDAKRVREGAISQATGGYAQACQRLSIERLERVCDELLSELGQRIEPEPELGIPVLLLDGTSISLEHVKGLLKAFPPGSNQHGEGHWGILKLVGLHDVRTGIALRPAWGAMYGEDAASEQKLAAQALAQAPEGSVILGDSNFGIFSFAYAVHRSKRHVLFRLTACRAKALGASKLLPQGETTFCWKPSRYERRKNPTLPLDAEIQGRLIVVTANGLREPLYLFTTLAESANRIVELYALRWNMELDLRTLKDTLRLHHLRGKSPAAVEKELLIAVVAYGLVRACMALAARRGGLAPRRLSFTQCHGLLNEMLEKLCSAIPEVRMEAYDRLLTFMAKSKLPQRSKRRAYPRAVWGHARSFPKRPAPKTEATKTK